MRAPHGPGQRHWDVVAIDEAQRIKNATSSLAITVKALKRDRSWALTGTPLENRIDDLISILDFVAPGHRDQNQPRSSPPRPLLQKSCPSQGACRSE